MLLSIISVREGQQLTTATDRKVLYFECDNTDNTDNTMRILKKYLEQVYQHDFEVTGYFKVSINAIYNISNHIRDSFYFNPTHSVFGGIEIDGDYFIELAKLFNLINDIRKHMLNSILDNVYFYVGGRVSI